MLPLLALNAASRLRVCPLTLKKLPPNQTVLLLAVTVATFALTEGLNAVFSALVAVSKAATWLRTAPSTVVKSPTT